MFKITLVPFGSIISPTFDQWKLKKKF
jgi:hypothetical protein